MATLRGACLISRGAVQRLCPSAVMMMTVAVILTSFENVAFFDDELKVECSCRSTLSFFARISFFQTNGSRHCRWQLWLTSTNEKGIFFSRQRRWRVETHACVRVTACYRCHFLAVSWFNALCNWAGLGPTHKTMIYGLDIRFPLTSWFYQSTVVERAETILGTCGQW